MYINTILNGGFIYIYCFITFITFTFHLIAFCMKAETNIFDYFAGTFSKEKPSFFNKNMVVKNTYNINNNNNNITHQHVKDVFYLPN